MIYTYLYDTYILYYIKHVPSELLESLWWPGDLSTHAVWRSLSHGDLRWGVAWDRCQQVSRIAVRSCEADGMHARRVYPWLSMQSWIFIYIYIYTIYTYIVIITYYLYDMVYCICIICIHVSNSIHTVGDLLAAVYTWQICGAYPCVPRTVYQGPWHCTKQVSYRLFFASMLLLDWMRRNCKLVDLKNVRLSMSLRIVIYNLSTCRGSS